MIARVWDGEPDAEAAVWDEQAEVDYESVTGDVAAWVRGVPIS
ncbi:hypothetical protein [Streptomyces sp. NPDC058401]